MHRSSLWLVFKKFEGTIAGDKGYMTYQQACSIFGFQMSDRLEMVEIKKRFNTLVMRFHPDHGGTSEQFQLLREAHKLLLAHRHDKGAAMKGTDAGVNFRRMSYDEMTNSIHRQTAENSEYRSFSIRDIFFFATFSVFLVSLYLYRTFQTQMRILCSRWSYTEEQLSSETVQQNVSSWHPWRSDRNTRDVMDEVALLQRSMSLEMLEEKRRAAPPVHMPWQPGGPFAKGQSQAVP
ncbi:hypothetical protein ERJ75_000713300 [Trypanosoma vivax]|uniref:Putative chaperone protein DNAj n=1 Tax=Trypanosoma vivax (strain Y486) TaxID=1055687 RepID=G0TTU0_TRYVY|nr:putative chaperone protein DNAj [Trypanosoma vivax]KAH8614020.1 hypothetical protein ERJ75_000713300 [Trypanosoma vivax]CCC47372.1 putative chaperone protein DNAj [Trypanosoma vivax Y486]